MEQKKKGMGLVIAMSILLAVTTALSLVVFIFNPFNYGTGGIGDSEGGLFGGVSTGSENLIPPGATVLKDIKYLDIQGDWKGQFTFTKMEGYDQMGVDSDLVKELMAKPADFEFEFDEDGEWDIDIDAMSGMMLSSRDFRIDEPKTIAEQEAHIIKNVSGGKFKFNMDLSTDDDDFSGSANMHFDGIVCEDSEDMLIVGTIKNSMTNNGMTIVMEGTYMIRPEELEYTDGIYE